MISISEPVLFVLSVLSAMGITFAIAHIIKFSVDRSFDREMREIKIDYMYELLKKIEAGK